MPCLEEVDLSELADKHIKAQSAVIKNLRSRLGELEAERVQLINSPDSRGGRLEVVEGAIKHLRGELNGEVESPPGSMRFVKDKNKKTAEERASVMAALYKRRQSYVFHDTTKGDVPRKASIFGLPTIKEMVDRGEIDIAEEMMARATSLIQSRSGSRNPVDFLDTLGLEVKEALSNQIEWHHIYNNVYVDDNGRVTPKSFKFYADKSGNLTLNIVPSHWNAAEHGRDSQFIALMDGMHAGEDPVAHLHYYRFTKAEAAPIKDKIKNDIGDIVADAKKREEKLSAQLGKLESRRRDPAAYEAALLEKQQLIEEELESRKLAAKGITSKPKTSLTPEQLEIREAFDAKKRELNQVKREISEHQELSGIQSRIERIENEIGDLESRINSIKLNRIPVGERETAKAERDRLKGEILALKKEKSEAQKILKKKGDVDEQIKDTQNKLNEARQIAALDEEKALQMFEESNGFFSFDKGFAEKEDHAVYRPIMNEEVSRFYVRETIQYLQDTYGDRWLEELQAICERRYRDNLLSRIDALRTKVEGKVA